ncbi:MAG: hypothetical protein ACOYJQ_01620 [Pseudochelatococcus sp.]|uniref:hypothetical protein n=1 Tax=Pseudochelatococcus sp. TaxID=2020869 RepID=UPI003D9404CC
MTRVDLKNTGLVIGAVCAALALGLTGGAPAARAQEDTSGVFMRDLLGKLGIIEGEAPNIDYSERAPLVLPPGSGALPPPRTAGTAGGGHPNWPLDPDVVARQKAIEAANAPAPNNRDRESARPLSVDEIRAGRRAGGGGRSGPPAEGCYGDSCSARPLDPRALRATRQQERAPVLVRGQEPERSSLTQPPRGYRLPTDAPVPDTASGPVERRDTASPYEFFNRNNRSNN